MYNFCLLQKLSSHCGDLFKWQEKKLFNTYFVVKIVTNKAYKNVTVKINKI